MTDERLRDLIGQAASETEKRPDWAEVHQQAQRAFMLALALTTKKKAE